MSNLVISINANLLKLTSITNKGEFQAITKEIPDNLVSDGVILDIVNFSTFLDAVINEFLPKGRNNYALNFLIEPENVYSEFIELPKDEDESIDTVIEKAKHQLEGVDLNELYYTHNRLAPFMRHFIGVRKVNLEKYLELSESLKMALKSILPWTFLLPKYTKELEPSLYITLGEHETVFSLAEMNNIYFSKVFNKKFKTAELEEYVHDLANYDRTTSVKKVYLLGKESLKLNDKYELTKVTLPNSSVDETYSYEKHLLTHYMLDFSSDLLESSSNVLHLLPVPTTVKNTSSLVYAGAVVSVLLLLAGVVYGGVRLNKSQQQNTLAEVTPVEQPNVSENVAGAETEIPEPSVVEEKPVEEVKPLEKKDLKILIQNGAGVAGLASKTKTFLEDLGYKIYDIGDADITGRENTVLKFKQDKIGYKEMLETDMKDKYLDIVVENDLPGEEPYDVLIVVGTKNDL